VRQHNEVAIILGIIFSLWAFCSDRLGLCLADDFKGLLIGRWELTQCGRYWYWYGASTSLNYGDAGQMYLQQVLMLNKGSGNTVHGLSFLPN
jgi:hypothetical protein